MANEKWRMDLKKDIREALDPYFPEGEVIGPGGATSAALRAVLPHLEAAYKRGEVAGRSRAGYRLVAENERLRRQIPNPRKESE